VHQIAVPMASRRFGTNVTTRTTPPVHAAYPGHGILPERTELAEEKWGFHRVSSYRTWRRTLRAGGLRHCDLDQLRCSSLTIETVQMHAGSRSKVQTIPVRIHRVDGFAGPTTRPEQFLDPRSNQPTKARVDMMPSSKFSPGATHEARAANPE
jgi:hypothetical protein